MKYEILKLNFLLKKINISTFVIIAILSLSFVFIFYYINFQSLSYVFKFQSEYFNDINVTHVPIKFDIHGKDTLVFLHIQKTGGTLLERALTKDGLTNFKCKCRKFEKRCNCLNKLNLNWIFSRYSTGWRCGLHADWTELSACVEKYLKTEAEKVGIDGKKRRTYWFTMLREPINRYMSEWKHVQRGATWRRSKHVCKGRRPTLTELVPCYNGSDWSGVSLIDFMSCTSNLANNRQSRMIADLATIDCYNGSASPKLAGPLLSKAILDREQKMLESAKLNLAAMTFFGLLEHLKMTQYLFQRTFQLIFVERWAPLNITHSQLISVPQSINQRLKEINNLDLKLYRFAKQLFLARISIYLIQDRKRIETYCPDLAAAIDWDRLKSDLETGTSGSTAFPTNDSIINGSYSGSGFGYLLSQLALFNVVVDKLLLLDGTRPPSPEIMELRKQKWHKKIWKDMKSELLESSLLNQ